MEILLRKIIEENIPGLKGEIYPTNAPELSTKPYLVYQKTNTNLIKTYEGFSETKNISYVFNIMATKYGQMITIRNQIEKIIKDLVGEKHENINFEDIDIRNIHETYEHQLKINRGIIDFTIYFNEEE